MTAAVVWGDYVATCLHAPKCPGTRKFSQGMSMGLQVGDKVPFDQTNHQGTTCPNCKRASLVVTSAPTKAGPPPVKGFTQIPEK